MVLDSPPAEILVAVVGGAVEAVVGGLGHERLLADV
jgi:hypothetical protein